MRNGFVRQLIALSALQLAAIAGAQAAALMWYDKPAADWEKEALPIGNGRIGAMVFGGTDSERLQVAEKSLWTGGPGTEGGYDFGLPAESQAELMRSIGKQLLEGAQLKPEDVAKQLGRKMHNYGDYQSFGDLIIERESDEAPVTDYRRELDLDTATARVKFKQGGAGFRREYFVSYPDQALVARWYGTSVQKLRVKFVVPDNRTVTTRVDGARLLVSGALKSNGLQYAAELRVIAECGTVSAAGDSLIIESECPVTFVLAARTNYRMQYPDYRAPGADPAAAAAKDAAAASKGHYTLVAQRHAQDHQALFRRVTLTLD